MTGYGKAVVAYKDKKINVEVKSLNSKQLDLQTRIAPLYREKEMEIRQMVAAAVIRGKVDFSLWIEKDTVVDATPINAALIENYYRQLKEIAGSSGINLFFARAVVWCVVIFPDITLCHFHEGDFFESFINSLVCKFCCHIELFIYKRIIFTINEKPYWLFLE